MFTIRSKFCRAKSETQKKPTPIQARYGSENPPCGTSGIRPATVEPIQFLFLKTLSSSLFNFLICPDRRPREHAAAISKFETRAPPKVVCRRLIRIDGSIRVWRGVWRRPIVRLWHEPTEHCVCTRIRVAQEG